MNCPNCDATANRITETRNDTIESKLRRRKCIECGHSWWSCEVELPPGAVKWVRPDGVNNRLFPVPRRAVGFRRIMFS